MSKITALPVRIRARPPTVRSPFEREQDCLDYERETQVQRRILREQVKREANAVAQALVREAIRSMTEK